MRRTHWMGALLPAVVLALTATAGREASAGPVTYAFDTLNSSGSAPSAPDLGSVTISDNGTNQVYFTLAAPTEPANATKWGFDNFGFNYKNLSSSDFSVSGPTGWTQNSPNNMDGFGSFLVTIGNNGSPLLGPVITLTFTNNFAAAVANNYADLSVLSTKANGEPPAYFAAHLIENLPNNNNNSGYVGVTGLNATPEPSTLLMGTLAVVGGVGARWRGRRKGD